MVLYQNLLLIKSKLYTCQIQHNGTLMLNLEVDKVTAGYFLYFASIRRKHQEQKQIYFLQKRAVLKLRLHLPLLKAVISMLSCLLPAKK